MQQESSIHCLAKRSMKINARIEGSLFLPYAPTSLRTSIIRSYSALGPEKDVVRSVARTTNYDWLGKHHSTKTLMQQPYCCSFSESEEQQLTAIASSTTETN